ncbi:MAG: ABC transporter ATP-binding protein [Candidatus Marinimicrobia bacterium]|jgi:subfamily B ATP-binding cassette protein MsbA|nr:ABC transporter ATP-binding protein [Candidatus Neomarinimicrobiota bacterium]MBT3497220.1 ABC transporter ATP-binding protein [Candidatus Neomarinimicrobiota bacterium]MBT3692479.1 ABC transporter ATP-binding protein [Candidatus Neomarinimicrobiota bacterium]MBT3732722.1 ABC transporter ATP-binding protein [Candidatus Neomarinimicrobiota bacterium]MBT4145060.1 ABC transporter ATP-binding protein [Candidatus Neomarinimicrobiota bacterium]
MNHSPKQSAFRRLMGYVAKYTIPVSLSAVASILFVLLNSLSIWLTASLINSILSDFSELAFQQAGWAQDLGALTLNEKLKYWTNVLILRETPMESLKVLCLTILAVFMTKNIFLYLKKVLLTFVQLRLVTELRNKLYAHIQTLSLGFFHHRKTGEISSIIINDVQSMQVAFSTSFQKILVEPFNIITFILLMGIISFKLTLISILVLPLAGVSIVYIGRSIRRKSRRTAVQIAGIMNIISETLSSIRVVKSFSMEKKESKRFAKESEHFFKLLFRRARLAHFTPSITETIGVSIGVVLLWIGGMDVIQYQAITSEDFIRFILLLFSVLAPIKSLTNVNVQIQTGLASAERVFALMDIEPEIVDSPSAKQIESFKNNVQLEHVFFQYNDESEQVISDISFEIQRGEVVALVGPSGAGKSTIADLIPRFYDIDSGSILIDGKPIKEIQIQSLRSQMGIVSQETILFNDTIRNNIAYGINSATEAEIESAVKAANAWEFIVELPEKLDTNIGEKGARLSGGQRQRIAIARALLANPPILILDEATSALDTESEQLVQEALDRLMNERTVLVIAHRLSTIVNADKIIVLEKGKIVEMGSHKDLLATKGLYKKLHDIQFNDRD